MSPNPADFLSHLRQSGYHPRSDKHSNSLAEAIVADLIGTCQIIREKAARGALVYTLNFTLHAATAEWNVDLVFGPPAPGQRVVPGEKGIARQVPVAVEIAIELKAVMTAHRKAVKNRKRDLEAHHEHVHKYNNLTIAGGVLIVNASSTFQSPLVKGLTTHRNPTKLVEHCITQLRAVSVRGGPTGYGLEAKAAVVVSADNVDLAAATYLSSPPAPQLGDPLHYDGFIRSICEFYRARFPQ